MSASRFLALAFAFVPALGGAATAPTGTAAAAASAVPSATGGLLQVVASLAFILVVIVALAWLATRLRLTPRSASPALRVIADVPVGPKERVVLLKVGESQALVGVGADGVRPLALLERNVDVPEQELPGQAFAARLQTLMQGKKP